MCLVHHSALYNLPLKGFCCCEGCWEKCTSSRKMWRMQNERRIAFCTHSVEGKRNSRAAITFGPHPFSFSFPSLFILIFIFFILFYVVLLFFLHPYFFISIHPFVYYTLLFFSSPVLAGHVSPCAPSHHHHCVTRPSTPCLALTPPFPPTFQPPPPPPRGSTPLWPGRYTGPNPPKC